MQLCHVLVLVSNLYFILSADPFSAMMEFFLKLVDAAKSCVWL